MKRTEMLQEIRKMRFKEPYEGWQEGRLSQEDAARILGICDRALGGIEIAMKNREWRDCWTNGSTRYPIAGQPWMK
jgi:hypothetical protein